VDLEHLSRLQVPLRQGCRMFQAAQDYQQDQPYQLLLCYQGILALMMKVLGCL